MLSLYIEKQLLNVLDFIRLGEHEVRKPYGRIGCFLRNENSRIPREAKNWSLCCYCLHLPLLLNVCETDGLSVELQCRYLKVSTIVASTQHPFENSVMSNLYAVDIF